MGERSTATTRPGPRLVEGLSKDSGALKDIVPSLFPGPSSPPTGPGLSKLDGLQEKAWIYLLPHSLPDDPHTIDPWPNYSPSGSSWRLLVGRAHWATEQWLNKTCCLVTVSRVRRHSNGCYLLRTVLILLCHNIICLSLSDWLHLVW